ncbi:MAG: TonB-dependent receptor [Saprospiraceae bacterium]
MKGPHLLLNYLLYSTLIGMPFSLFAQSPIVVVYDVADRNPLFQTEIYNDDFSNRILTNKEGQGIIDTSNNTIFHFSKQGYNLTSLSLIQLKNMNWKVGLTLFSEEIDEIILIGQNSFKESDKFHHIVSISAKEIKQTNPQTSADVLSHTGNVYVQKSQMGGGSPIIRGFEANRVLLVVDGVRMNNAIYRNGHLQNAITVDASIIHDVKILFGPNSLAYGSDAIGGVVAYTSKVPKFGTAKERKIEGGTFVRYATANQEKTIHADVTMGWERWATLTSVTITDYDDQKSGSRTDDRFPDFGLRPNSAVRINGIDQEISNPNAFVQIGTAYHQYDILQKIVFKPQEKMFLTGNFQFSNTGNVPRYDNLQEMRNGQLRYAEWLYGPQTRILSSFQIKNYTVRPWYDQYIITAAYQKIKEKRIIRNFQNDKRLRQNEDVNVFSFTGEFKIKMGNSLNLLYGFDSQWNDINSKAYAENIVTGRIIDGALSRYADGTNQYITYGLFGEADWSAPKSPFTLKAGLRYSGNSWKIKYLENAKVEWPESFINGINNNSQALTWSISGLYRIPSGLFLRSLISSAFRAPNIDDLSKIRINSNEITFPNTELTPEKAISTELSVGFKNENFSITTTGFYSVLRDAITRRPFTTPQGSSIYESFGESLDVVGNQNVQKAQIYGISLNSQINLSQEIKFYSSINYTKGKEKRENESDRPFAHIPPLYGNVRVVFSSTKWNIQLVVRYSAMKYLEDFGGSVDNPDLATPIGSLGWATYNLYSSYDINKKWSTTLGIENIYDKHYRPFGSGVSAAGRNVIVSMRYKY